MNSRGLVLVDLCSLNCYELFHQFFSIDREVTITIPCMILKSHLSISIVKFHIAFTALKLIIFVKTCY